MPEVLHNVKHDDWKAGHIPIRNLCEVHKKVYIAIRRVSPVATGAGEGEVKGISGSPIIRLERNVEGIHELFWKRVE